MSRKDKLNKPRAEIRFRNQAADKVLNLKAYIDEQRGNDPNDDTGLRLAEKLLNEILLIEQ